MHKTELICSPHNGQNYKPTPSRCVLVHLCKTKLAPSRLEV